MKKHLLSLVVLILVSACSSMPESVRYEEEIFGPTLLVDEYRIGVDDRVEVNVWKNPDLSIIVPVRPDGRISVPLVGEVLAGGRTPLEVSKEITDRLATFVKDPQVAVILVDLRSHEFLSRVRVTGAVRNPLSLPFRQGMSVLDVVLEAGGLNEFASGNGARLFRRQNGEMISIRIKLEDMLQDGALKTNVLVEPGDVLTVPERIF